MVSKRHQNLIKTSSKVEQIVVIKRNEPLDFYIVSETPMLRNVALLCVRGVRKIFSTSPGKIFSVQAAGEFRKHFAAEFGIITSWKYFLANKMIPNESAKYLF